MTTAAPEIAARPQPTHSASTREAHILAAQSAPVRAMLDAMRGTPCPNCYDPLPDIPAITPTGVIVCDASCVEGWMNGEECKGTLALIRRIRLLIA